LKSFSPSFLSAQEQHDKDDRQNLKRGGI